MLAVTYNQLIGCKYHSSACSGGRRNNVVCSEARDSLVGRTLWTLSLTQDALHLSVSVAHEQSLLSALLAPVGLFVSRKHAPTAA